MLSMDDQSVPWYVLAVGLCFLTFGVRGILSLVSLAVLGPVVLVVAGILALYLHTRANQEPLCSRLQKQSNGRIRCGQDMGRRSSCRSNLTGSAAIDKPLQDMLGYVIRDYISPWFDKITTNNAFPCEVRRAASEVVSLLADRMASVDWVPYLTTKLVDDVASHVRLFKSARNKSKAPLKEGETRSTELVTLFFDYELCMEGSEVCRDTVCLDSTAELQYLQDLSETLLYLLLPRKEFSTPPVRCFVREMLVSCVLRPTIDYLCDPDTVNQTLVWLHSDYQIKNDVFVSVLRHTDNLEELDATKQMLQQEIDRLQSKDSKSQSSEDGRLQLNSLLYLRKLIDTRVTRLQNGFSGNTYGLPAYIDWSQVATVPSSAKLFSLPLEVVLKNNIALSYFIDYMTSIGCQYYVFFYLNIEGWKVSAEQQLQAVELELLHTGSNTKHSAYIDSMREAALSIYQEYLSDKASPRLPLDDTLTKKLLFRVRTEPPDPGWFDEVAMVVYNKMMTDDKLLNSFKRSQGYVKLLAELELLRADEDLEEGSLADSVSLGSWDGSREGDKGSEGSDSDPLSSRGSSVLSDKREASPGRGKLRGGHSRTGSGSSVSAGGKLERWCGDICRVELARENGGGKQYIVYVITVKRGGDQWEVCRRYSDFHSFHEIVSEKFPSLSKIPFPGKKTWGNLERNVVEKRKKMLNFFLKETITCGSLPEYRGLQELVVDFLTPGWEGLKQGALDRAVMAVSQDFQRSVKTVSNSVKTVSNAVTAVPVAFVKNVDNAMDGLISVFQSKDGEEGAILNSEKVGASIDRETNDNIPLRITLLLLDEVFDLADRNMWLRRQIVTVLRQIIKSMFGDIVNKKIVDYMATFTAPTAVAGYLNNIKEHFWPGGSPAAPPTGRDDVTRLRTQIAAKAAVFSSLNDELRRVIGSETSRAGMTMLLDMLQYRVINKRLVIVLLEGILQTLFPEHEFPAVFRKLHSRSSRIRDDFKNSQRTAHDLRRRETVN